MYELKSNLNVPTKKNDSDFKFSPGKFDRGEYNYIENSALKVSLDGRNNTGDGFSEEAEAWTNLVSTDSGEFYAFQVFAGKEVLEKDENTQFFKRKLYPFIYGSLGYLNNYTNVELENKLIVADIYELGEENLKYGMYIFVDLFWDKIKKDRKKNKAIYLDEIWRLIGVTSNKEVASFIYKIFKTIRKYGGSGVAITQDVSDLFSLENGNYGKSILNNSEIKTFFSLEEDNIKLLSNQNGLTTTLQQDKKDVIAN